MSSKRQERTEEERAAERARQRAKRKRRRQKDDDAPLEVSAKKPPPPIGAQHRKKPAGHRARDPRFDDMCGEYSEATFRSTYSFLDQEKEDELKEMQAMMRKSRDPEAKEKLRRVVDKYRAEIQLQQRRDRERTERSRVRKQELRAVEQGKKPFFLKKSDRKKVNLAEQFIELEKSGKLDKFMAKRRKKNVAKDRRWVPEVRRGGGGGGGGGGDE